MYSRIRMPSKLFVAVLILWSSTAWGENYTPDSLSFFTDIGTNLRGTVTGWNSVYHLAGAGITPVLITQDIDSRVQEHFHEHKSIGYLTFPVAPAGLMAAVVPYLLYRRGTQTGNRETLGAAYATGQAVLLAFSYQTLLKAFTGRADPIGNPPEGVAERSRDFRFGFLRRGVFHGWPSGHAMTITALMSSLTTYYPENRTLRLWSYATVLYTVVGVTSLAGGEMHWFSDGVAGALMGWAIGRTVGSSFRQKVRSTEPDERTGLRLVPFLTPQRRGIVLCISVP